MKLPQNFTKAELDAMSSTDMAAYEKEIASALNTLEAERQSFLLEKHELCLTLKKRGSTYLEFQKKAYDLMLQASQKKQEIAALITPFLQMKRDWAAGKGMNQVDETPMGLAAIRRAQIEYAPPEVPKA